MECRLKVVMCVLSMLIAVKFTLGFISSFIVLTIQAPTTDRALITKNGIHFMDFEQKRLMENDQNTVGIKVNGDINVQGASTNHEMDINHQNGLITGDERGKVELRKNESSRQFETFSEKSVTFSRNMKSSTVRRLEVNYTLVYRKHEPSNVSNLFLYDDKGKCHGLSCKWPKMPGATKELVQWTPEIFQKVPGRFLGSFKNPCWLRNGTELNCLPYFYVIGMFKCGTTDIWSKIVAHPDVVDVPKEPHWWGPRRNGYTETPIHKREVLATRKITGGEDDSSFEWYLNLYKLFGISDLINNRVSTAEGIPYHQKIFGDASISTSYAIGLNWTKTFPNASEPVYTNAQLIRAVQPDAKIILMVRNPVVRALSWYWYSHLKANGKTFHEFVVRYIGCFKSCLEKHNPRYCAYAAKCPYKLIPELQVGIYYVYTRDWIEAFTRDGILVLQLEDWEANPIHVYRKILKFLDLRELSENELDKIIHTPRRNVNRRTKHILPETKKILEEFFEPYNREMSLLMNDDKFLYPLH